MEKFLDEEEIEEAIDEADAKSSEAITKTPPASTPAPQRTPPAPIHLTYQPRVWIYNLIFLLIPSADFDFNSFYLQKKKLAARNKTNATSIGNIFFQIFFNSQLLSDNSILASQNF